jgi:hypothetical protein
MKYSVKIYGSNPRNNETIECDSKTEAVAEMKKHASDDAGDVCKLYENDTCIAYRELNKKNISWMNPVSAAASAMGSAKSAKKSASSAANGAKGGRPVATWAYIIERDTAIAFVKVAEIPNEQYSMGQTANQTDSN